MLPVLIIPYFACISVASPLALAVEPISATGENSVSGTSTPSISAPTSSQSPVTTTLAPLLRPTTDFALAQTTTYNPLANDQTTLASDWANSISDLPGTVPGCYFTKTAVKFGFTYVNTMPCISGLVGEGHNPLWGTNTVPPTGGGMFTVVPRPQTSITGLAPIENPAPISEAPAAPKSVGPITTRHGSPGNPVQEPPTTNIGLVPVSTPPTPPAPKPQSNPTPAKPTVAPITVAPPSIPPPGNPPAPPSIDSSSVIGGINTAEPAAAPTTTPQPLPPPSGGAASVQPVPSPNKPAPANSAQSISQSNGESAAPHQIVVTPIPQQSQAPQSPPIAATPAPQITVGSSVVTADSSSNFIIGQGSAAQTLAPGGPAVTHSGNVISLALPGNSVAFGASTQDIAPMTTAAPPVVISFAGQTLTADSASQFQVNGQTLTPGAPAIVLDGQTVSLAPHSSAVFINGQSQAIQPTALPSGPPILSIGGSKITANSASQFVIGSQTLSAGSPAITFNGQRVSIAQGGSKAIFGPTIQAIGKPDTFTATVPPTLDIGGGNVITANAASQFVIGSQILKPGAVITAEGTTYSLAASGSAIVINGLTSALASSQVLATIAPPFITLGPSSSILTANSQSNYIIGSETLSPGGPAITISGTRYSLASDASDFVIGSSTEHLQPQYLAMSTVAPILTVGSERVSPISGSDYVFGGTQILTPGGKVTVSGGTVLSLAPGDVYLMVGTSTETLHPTMVVLASTTKSVTGGHGSMSRTLTTVASSTLGALGDLPTSGGLPVPSPTPTPTGAACKRGKVRWGILGAGVGAVLAMG